MLIKVKVSADVSAEKVVKKADDLLLVSVNEPAERGQANERVLKILRREYPGKSLRIVSGHHRSAKIIEVSQ